MSTCLAGSDLKEFKKADEAFVENGAPVFTRDLPVYSAIELQAKIIAESTEDPGVAAHPGSPDREEDVNPAPTAASLLEIVQETKALRADLEAQLLEQGAKPAEARRLSDEAYPFPLFTQKNLDINPKYFLSESTYKLDKASGYGWYTPGLYLAPATMSRVANLCVDASEGCKAACLVASGHGDMEALGPDEMIRRILAGRRLNDIVEVRIRRTLLYVFNREGFREGLIAQIKRNQAKAGRLKFGVRLNCTSDIGWESEGIMEQFPDATFYDYTKIPHRVNAFLESKAFEHFGGMACEESDCILDVNPASKWPKNYYLSFSFSEINMAWCLVFLKRGANIVVPFDDSLGKDEEGYPILPSHFLGRPVVDGDIFDMRFLDYTYWREKGIVSEPPPYVVGLAVKGVKQRRDQKEVAESGGFFFSAKDAEARGDDPDFIIKALKRNVENCFKQKLGNGKNPLQYLPTKTIFKRYVPDLAEAYAEILDEALRNYA